MKHLAIAAAILFAWPLAAGAEVPAPAAPDIAKTSPEAAPEAANPAPDATPKAPQTAQERQEANAAKLAGLVRFVGESCEEAQPDYERFKAVVSAMGVDLDAISKGELLMRSMGYTEAYRKNVDESCRKAQEMFGEKGKAIPGLVLRKAW
ncbi:hypothetical protein OKC48_26510 [Methylorubrum extorquens]|uniref:hypothetical protein n=1 Tax=Methylorubrum extorquens TaxID=408 RepID=UPI0022387304|nr:hypothetical protein [Methylorubrum extorquens]UYW26742.1 hypothetical protein OKC48_26510 [Methylorubrum extorquens]